LSGTYDCSDLLIGTAIDPESDLATEIVLLQVVLSRGIGGKRQGKAVVLLIGEDRLGNV
jgi:hypothetical protein